MKHIRGEGRESGKEKEKGGDGTRGERVYL
jgi:hypothetical protein